MNSNPLPFLSLIFVLHFGNCCAAPGDLDPTFSGDGKLRINLGIGSTATAVAIAPDGKVLVAGNRDNGGGALVRINLDGMLDSSFGTNGIRTLDYGSIERIALQSDGKIVVVGTRFLDSSDHDFFVARFSGSNGALDNAFGPNGNGYVFLDFEDSRSHASGVAIQADDKIVVAGTQLAFFDRDVDFAVARLLPNGGNDPSFGSNGKVLMHLAGATGQTRWPAVVIQPSGKIVLAGSQTSNTNVETGFVVARLNPTGSVDKSPLLTDFGTFQTNADDVAMFPDGRFVVVGTKDGFFDAEVDFAIAGYDDETFFGSAQDREVSDFGQGQPSRAHGVTAQPDNKVVVVGYKGYSTNGVFALTRYLVSPTGSLQLDTGFGANGLVTTSLGLKSWAFATAIQRDGKIVVVGGAFDSGSYSDFAIARFESGLQPEIAVEQPAGTNLVDGSATVPFGTVNIGSNVVKTVTVRNTGGAVLTGLSVSKDGTNAAEFSVNTAGMSTTLAVNGSTTFTITFTAAVAGSRVAAIHIASNDANENPFDIALTGSGVTAPEIAVSGNGANIPDGDSTPSLTDHTDFGNASTVGGMVTRTYTVANTGTANLTLGTVTVGGTNAGNFTVTTQPTSPVTAGSSTTLQVVFDPSATGLRSATLSFTTNDTDETPFNFSIQGTGGLAPEIAVSGNGANITDGDSTPSLTDHTDFGSLSTRRWHGDAHLHDRKHRHGHSHAWHRNRGGCKRRGFRGHDATNLSCHRREQHYISGNF